jgi:hypothetical protein
MNKIVQFGAGLVQVWCKNLSAKVSAKTPIYIKRFALAL